MHDDTKIINNKMYLEFYIVISIIHISIALLLLPISSYLYNVEFRFNLNLLLILSSIIIVFTITLTFLYVWIKKYNKRYIKIVFSIILALYFISSFVDLYLIRLLG
jgi:hypothetical protein